MSAPAVIEHVKASLVALKMPRALEILDVTLRGIERGEIGTVEAIDALLTEELTIRENRRVKMAVQMAKLSAIKTLTGFDFAFQPSLDKNRILALAGLQFIDRAEAVHLIGPPGTGKTHLSLALGSKRSKPAGASTSVRSQTSSLLWRRPNATARCAIASGTFAASPCSSSTKLDTCRSSPAAETCSSSSSTPDTKRAP